MRNCLNIYYSTALTSNLLKTQGVGKPLHGKFEKYHIQTVLFTAVVEVFRFTSFLGI